MQRRLRQAFCSIKEHTSVSYAKIATIGGYCDLDLIVIKATAPDDVPLNEKYVQELLKIFSISPSSLHAFALCFSRRFGKTQCWRVALKSLLLIHRLLQSVPGNSPFREEFLLSKFNGYLSLNPCHFQDFSSSPDAAEDYTKFIRSYAHFLDESLEYCKEIEIEEYEYDHDHDHDYDQDECFLEKIKKLTRLLEFLPQLQGLIDRVIDCRPTGVASRNFIVQSAMKHIIRDSFVCYTSFRKEIVVVLDHLIQLPYRSCVEAFDIYKRAAIQANHLSEFYDWCKYMGLCGVYEYPFVDKVPDIQIRALGNFLNGMWQLTESSSPSSSSSSSSTTISPLASNTHSPSISTITEEEEDNKNRKQIVQIRLKVPFECDENKKTDLLQKNQELLLPLIQLEETDNDTINANWETLLEASLPPSSPCMDDNNVFFSPLSTTMDGSCGNNQHGKFCCPNFLYAAHHQHQVYNPYWNPSYSTNPFHNPCSTYPWRYI